MNTVHPDKVHRDRIQKLTDLPNVGPSVAHDLQRLGIAIPEQLKGQLAFSLYQQLCTLDQTRHDPCVLDVLISVVRFMDGEPAQSWWQYTAERKQRYPDL